MFSLLLSLLPSLLFETALKRGGRSEFLEETTSRRENEKKEGEEEEKEEKREREKIWLEAHGSTESLTGDQKGKKKNLTRHFHAILLHVSPTKGTFFNAERTDDYVPESCIRSLLFDNCFSTSLAPPLIPSLFPALATNYASRGVSNLPLFRLANLEPFSAHSLIQYPWRGNPRSTIPGSPTSVSSYDNRRPC